MHTSNQFNQDLEESYKFAAETQVIEYKAKGKKPRNSQRTIEYQMVDSQRRAMTQLLLNQAVSLEDRKTILSAYDRYISHKNIKNYFQHPILTFTQHLINGTLHELKDYTSVQINKESIITKCNRVA